MGKRTFSLVIVLLLVTFTAASIIKYYQPESTAVISFDSFPLKKDDWVGTREIIPDYVYDLLQPKEIFSANYTNADGSVVHLLFDFFTSGSSFGGPHSPRNCLPGSGWVITGSEHRLITVGDRTIPAERLQLQLDKKRQVMDFWYITDYGETSNDYVFKFYSMLSSLALEPGDVAFVRFVANDDEIGHAALDEFESLLIPEIYTYMPFD